MQVHYHFGLYLHKQTPNLEMVTAVKQGILLTECYFQNFKSCWSFESPTGL